MSNPVEASQSAPLFGGLSGYKRPALGKPTAVPGGLPAFRGRNNKPGERVAAPGIRTSYNRDNRGTNIVIPYSRIVPLEHLRDVGHVSPGDVVFAARSKLTPFGRGLETQMRLVGIDWLNKQLGGRPEYDGEKYSQYWQVGHNVLLGAKEGTADNGELASNAVADEWRSLAVLSEWTCDGVVLSNDQPNAHNSSGTRDGQLFNIAIQGVCNVSNGYSSFNGQGVESLHRGAVSNRNGYYDGGEPTAHLKFSGAFGDPFYKSYPLQMFDRKLRPLSDVYVGLVATRRRMQDEDATRFKEQLVFNAGNDSDTVKAIGEAVYYYTFHYVCFSSNQAFGYESGLQPGDVREGSYETNPSLTESASKRSRLHYEQATQGQEYDPYIGLSPREWEGMVGAWRIGKVLDIAATKKEQYYGGPADTTDSITVNVDIEFKDWRQLRRDFVRGDIGKRIPGAGGWDLQDPNANIPNPATLQSGEFVQDEGFVMQWPTDYTKPNVTTGRTINPVNVPLDPTTIDEAVRGSNKKRKQAGDDLKGITPDRPLGNVSFAVHGIHREGTSTRGSQGTPLDDDYTSGQGHEFSLLRAPVTQFDAYKKSLTPGGGPPSLVQAPLATLQVPNPENFGLGPGDENVRASAADNSAASATVAPAAPAVVAPPKGKSLAGAASKKRGVTPPKAKPGSVAEVVTAAPPVVPSPTAAVPTLSGGSGTAATVAAARAATSPAVSPAASPSVVNTGAAPATSPSAAATVQPSQARQGVRRGRAGEQATADVFASIFGGDAAPASSSAAEPSVQPSPSEGSDDGKQRGRVRRARDGR